MKSIRAGTYVQLKREIKRLGYTAPCAVLQEWLGCSKRYITSVMTLRKSFAPDDMDKILEELGKDRTAAAELFPLWGGLFPCA